ncbi:MAG: hypothetical protein Q4B85_05525 [Lachnospiraceae bacterium]|nr:hypothetical protein [Lachnospiraceae bacterium]
MGAFDFLKSIFVSKPKNKKNYKSGDLIFEKEYLIVGNEYPCKKRSWVKRNKIMKKMNIGDPVIVKKYKYEGKPAFMIIDPKTKLDIGVLGQGSADTVNSYYKKYKSVICNAVLTERAAGSFRVKIYITKK